MRLGYVTVAAHGAADALLAEVVAQLEADAIPLAGTVQVNLPRAGRPACDMELRLLPAGPRIRISTDRGALARGCRLDADALERAVPQVEAALAGAALLVVNKFGKQEASGRGLCGVIAEALARDIPALVGVNAMNLPAFRDFEAGTGEPLPAERSAIVDWCRSAIAARHHRPLLRTATA